MNLKNFKDAQTLLGKHVHFTAPTCVAFPSLGIKGKVVSLEYSSTNELLYIVSYKGRKLTVGANTSGLQVTV